MRFADGVNGSGAITRSIRRRVHTLPSLGGIRLSRIGVVRKTSMCATLSNAWEGRAMARAFSIDARLDGEQDFPVWRHEDFWHIAGGLLVCLVVLGCSSV
jgi:hypothetical protein